MKILFYFVLALFALLAPCIYLFMKYKNPYKLIMVFGKKGSGKTTFLTKTAIKYIKQGRPVYSTVYVPGAHLFDVNMIGIMGFPRNSVIFIDEVGMIWDNRNFKNFRPEVRDYFKLQRHYGHTVYLFSQTFDIDIKLRNLTDAMYLVRCHMGWFSVAKKIKRDIMLVQPTGESEARIADSLEFEPFWFMLFGAQTRIFTYIPHWTRFFDSYEAPELKPTMADYIPIPDNLIKFYEKRKKTHDKRRMDKHRLSKWHHRIGRNRKDNLDGSILGVVQDEESA